MRHRDRIKQWVAGLGVAVLASSGAAQEVQPAGFRRLGPSAPCPVPCPTVPCPVPVPPGAPPAPGMPGAPGTTPAPGTPGSPLDTSPLTTPPTTPPGAGTGAPAGGTTGLSESPSAGTGATASISPNMMGDQFGGRAFRFTGAAFPFTARFQATPPGLLPTADEPLLAPSTRGGTFVIVNPNVGIIDIQRIGQRLPSQLYGPVEPFRQDVPAPTFTPPEGARINQLLTAVSQPGGGLFTLVQGTLPGVTRISVDPVTGQLLPNNEILYSSVIRGEVSAFPVEVPNPGAGGVVGRVKLSEDNNPLPRDRFFFVYDYFSNTPLTSRGIDVNRFQFGVEKTFLNGRMSAEFRIPFAGTVASTTTAGFETTATELGDLRLALKALIYAGRQVFVSIGSGVTLPTASDLVVNIVNNNGQVVNLLRLENESVVVEPYLAILFVPTERLFAQLWTSVGGDVSGSPLVVNPEIIRTTSGVRFYDRVLVAVDGQLGYWLYRSNVSRLRGVAPFIELHWNHGIDVIDPLTFGTGQGLAVGGATVGRNELNLTVGMTMQFWNNLLVTVGGSAPLLDNDNRTFDAQYGVRVNWFFGRTARERNRAALVSTF